MEYAKDSIKESNLRKLVLNDVNFDAPDSPFTNPEDLSDFKIWRNLAMKQKLQRFEDIIIKSCSNILRRKISMISVLGWFSEDFGEQYSDEIQILCLRNLGTFNFYVCTKESNQ